MITWHDPAYAQHCANYNTDSGRPTRLRLPVRLLFVFSGSALTVLLSQRGEPIHILIGVGCALALLAVCTLRFGLLERLLLRVGCASAIGGGVLALYAAFFYARAFGERLFRFGEELDFSPALNETLLQHGYALAIPVGLLALPALFILLAAFIANAIDRAAAYRRESDANEKRFLLIAGVACAALIITLYAKTTVFYAPNAASDNIWDKVDVVYTSDTGALVETDVFRRVYAPENDIRQPLFGVFAAPFALLAGFVSELLFFAPNAYANLLAIVQAWLVLIVVSLWARMTTRDRLDRVFIRLVYLFAFPTLLFMLNLEQYVFAVFYLTLTVYGFVEYNAFSREAVWTAAAGTMLTSGAAVFLVPRERGVRAYWKSVFYACMLFLGVMIVFGRLPLLIGAAETLRSLTQFAGAKVPFLSRAMQYVNFVASCFLPVKSEVVALQDSVAVFQLCAVSAWNPCGFVMLGLCAFGFIRNARDRFSHVCAGWVAFSFAVLCLVGWGTAENGLTLYTFYYSWAFVALVVKGTERTLRNHPRARRWVYAAMALVLLAGTLCGLVPLIGFGLQYYPAR